MRKLQQPPLWKAPWKKDRKERNWEGIKVAVVIAVVMLVWKAFLMSPCPSGQYRKIEVIKYDAFRTITGIRAFDATKLLFLYFSEDDKIVV